MTFGRRISWALPVLVIGLYWGLLAALAGEITTNALMYGAAILLLSQIEQPFLPLGVRPLEFALPLILTGVLYDSQRYWGTAQRGVLHIAGPYELEKRLFGVPSPNGTLTLNEWFGLHLHPVLDLVTGGAYLTFMGIFMLVALLLTLRIYRGGVAAGAGGVGNDWSPERRFWTSQSLVWCFLVVNIVGYVTWYLYPAAPPWYVEAYGLETLFLDVPASLGRTARFDDLLGTSFFTRMYAYESNAFGAIPSLHISYPTLSVFFAFRLGMLRTFTLAFLALMCFAAVYLNHHYVIDVVLGVFYGLAAGVMTVVGAEWAITSSSSRPSAESRGASK